MIQHLQETEEKERKNEKLVHVALLPKIHRTFIRIDTTRSSGEWQKDQKIPFSKFYFIV